MEPRIRILLDALADARYFEDAASAALTAMLARCREAIASSPFRDRGRIMRGMVHLRPSDGYRRLVIQEESAAGSGGGDRTASQAFLPSATAWRWVAERRCPLAIDVNLGRVQAFPWSQAPVVVQEPSGPNAFDSTESAQRLLSREASHTYVIPLLSPRGSVDGMVSIEAHCRSAIGLDFIWPSCSDDLAVIARVAGPYLVGMPLRPAPAAEPDELLPVIGASMAGLVQMLRVFVAQHETILIRGPTGAGKSRLARWCHERSARRGRSFESIDLMTIPEDLQRGELFGWRKGAFSGATTHNPGCLGRAEGGTLFIDEIDKLSLGAQASLLKVMDERRYRSLGEASGDRRADVRFIVGTNADLLAAVREGRFREDLYYRINVLPVALPPLDERADEIPGWARFFAVRRHREAVPEGEVRLSPGGEALLLRSRWPGNLRQLDNIVRRAYAMALMEQGDAPREVALEAGHIERALGSEPDRQGRPLSALLEDAAQAFVRAAERRAADGGALDLDEAEVFKGFVLGVATRRLGSKEAAFRLLGKGSLVANRNHHKPFRRELDRVAALHRALGEGGAPPFEDLGEGDER